MYGTEDRGRPAPMTSPPRSDHQSAALPSVPSIAPAERAAAIGSRLRQIFEEAAAEPLPDAFEDLLRKLS